MKDSLEKFIQENRTEFDREVPNLKVWAEIDKRISTQPQAAKQRTLWRYVWMAASVVFLLTAGALIGLKLTQNSLDAQMAVNEERNAEYQEMELFYKNQVKEKIAQLANYNDDPTVNEDLEQIDEFLLELKQELKNAPKGGEEQIVNAMVSNYQTKIAILEKVLERIQSTNQESINKSKENERIDI